MSITYGKYNIDLVSKKNPILEKILDAGPYCLTAPVAIAVQEPFLFADSTPFLYADNLTPFLFRGPA